MPHPMAHLSCFCNHLLRTGGKSLRGPRCRVRRSVELTDWFCETAWSRFAADRGLIGSLCAQAVPEKARLAQEAGAKKLEESTVSNPERAVDDPGAELTSTEWRDLGRLAALHGARPRGILSQLSDRRTCAAQQTSFSTIRS